MTTNEVYGELLYVGLVAEKGRAYGKLWTYRYRRTLRQHAALWQRMIGLMRAVPKGEEEHRLFQDFIRLCGSNGEIGKHYPLQPDSLALIERLSSAHSGSGIEQAASTRESMVILELMDELVAELRKLLKARLFVKWYQIHVVLRALHNLPRYFLHPTATGLFGIKNASVDFRHAIDYAMDNMDQSMRSRYKKYLDEHLA